jgi:hypothetical protein
MLLKVVTSFLIELLLLLLMDTLLAKVLLFCVRVEKYVSNDCALVIHLFIIP